MEKGSVKILLMRHAESVYNRFQSDFAKEHGTHPKFEMFENRWVINEQIIDALLSPTGVTQCLDAGKQIPEKHPSVKYVISSPMRRALLTGLHSFKEYPTPIEYTIEPWAREILLSQCDIGYHAIDLLKQHPEIDSSVLKNDRLWFLDYYVDNPEQNYAPRLREAYAKAPKIETVVNFFRENFTHLESYSQMHARTHRLKQSLAKFIANKQAAGVTVGDGEIVLVAHSKILRYFIGGFDEHGEQVHGKEELKNTQIIEFDFDYAKYLN